MSYGTMAVDWEQRIDYTKLREERLQRAKDALEAHDLGALVCFEFNSVRYITSTHVGEWARDKFNRFTVLPRGGEPILFDPAPQAKRETCPWLEGRIRPPISGMKGAVPANVGRVDDMAAEIHEVLADHGVADDPIGLDISEYALVQSLEDRGLDLVDGQQAILDARMIKTDEEVELLRTAGAMVDAAYDTVVRHLRPGITENELVAKVNERLYDMGSERVSCVNCVSGPRGAPHPHTMSDRRIRPNELVFLDIMHSFNGYQTCYYRTFSCGEPSEAQVEAYDTAWTWLKDAIDAVEPGVTTADVARQFPKAEDFGFESEDDAFLLQVGHGVGLGLWEKPVISRLFSLENPFEIREGMTFALETWCPVEGGDGAARIEEEVVVTEDGCEPLFKYPPEDLIACGMPDTDAF